MTTVTRNGAAIFYEDRGTGDPPLVFLHGLGRHDHFRAQLDHFGSTHRVIAPDLPGYGRSDAPQRSYAIPDLADDVGWLLHELDTVPAVIIGHSMSGPLAVQLAAQDPDSCRALVLLDPLPLAGAPHWRERMIPFVQALRGADYQQAIRGYAEGRMFRPTDDERMRKRIVDDMAAARQHVVVSTLASTLEWDGEAAARRVRVPVLAITAGDGVPGATARLPDLLPGVELGRVVGAGHFAHAVDPNQVNAMIERFLSVSLGAGATA